MSDFIDIRPARTFYDDGLGIAFHTPSIQVSLGLQESLDQAGQTLKLSDETLNAGTLALGVTKSVAVKFAELPGGSDGVGMLLAISRPDHDQPAFAEILMDPDKSDSTRRERRREELDLNTSFWLGVTICDLLARGKEKAIKKERDRHAKNAELAGVYTLIACTAGGILVSRLISEELHSGLVGWAVPAGVVIEAILNNRSKRNRIRAMSVGDYAVHR